MVSFTVVLIHKVLTGRDRCGVLYSRTATGRPRVLFRCFHGLVGIEATMMVVRTAEVVNGYHVLDATLGRDVCSILVHIDLLVQEIVVRALVTVLVHIG